MSQTTEPGLSAHTIASLRLQIQAGGEAINEALILLAEEASAYAPGSREAQLVVRRQALLEAQRQALRAAWATLSHGQDPFLELARARRHGWRAPASAPDAPSE